MKLLLVLPEGIGIRNFVLGKFLAIFSPDDEIVVWHQLPYNQNELSNLAASHDIRWMNMPVQHEGQAAYFFRRTKALTQLFIQKVPGTDVILTGMLRRKGQGLHALRERGCQAAARILAISPHNVLRLDNAHATAVRHTHYFRDYLNTLQEEKPDIVFCSHQRSEWAVPALLAARELNIPTATFIYSWDNLPKGRMAVHADHYLVWSDHMRDEMHQYYPDVADDRIHVVGTPQFEHYFDSRLFQPREVFLHSLGLDPDRPVICFSGNDLTTSPHDEEYLEDLVQALLPFPMASRPQILFCSSPTDTSTRYQAVLARYPEIVVATPRWVRLGQSDWSKVIPTFADLELLVNTVLHADLVVNLGSTMAVDFAILGKPALYLKYNPHSWKPGEELDIHDIYRMSHFNEMYLYDPVDWICSAKELGTVVMDVLHDPARKAKKRQDWVKFLACHPLDQASQRCVDALRKIAGPKG